MGGRLSDRGRALRPVPKMSTPLFINNIPSLDRLVALEYGQVDDGRPPSDFDHVAHGVWRHVDGESRKPLGFVVLNPSEADLDAVDAECLWRSETSDVPLFGLTDATIAEIISATRAKLGKRPTLNRVFFDRATASSGREAVDGRTRRPAGPTGRRSRSTSSTARKTLMRRSASWRSGRVEIAIEALADEST